MVQQRDISKSKQHYQLETNNCGLSVWEFQSALLHEWPQENPLMNRQEDQRGDKFWSQKTNNHGFMLRILHHIFQNW